MTCADIGLEWRNFSATCSPLSIHTQATHTHTTCTPRALRSEQRVGFLHMAPPGVFQLDDTASKGTIGAMAGANQQSTAWSRTQGDLRGVVGVCSRHRCTAPACVGEKKNVTPRNVTGAHSTLSHGVEKILQQCLDICAVLKHIVVVADGVAVDIVGNFGQARFELLSAAIARPQSGRHTIKKANTDALVVIEDVLGLTNDVQGDIEKPIKGSSHKDVGNGGEWKIGGQAALSHGQRTGPRGE